MQGFQHYEFTSTESEHYWCPADNEADLYEQLSHHKYQEIPRSAVIQDAQIGEGEFGVVSRGEWQNTAGVVKQVAIKMLHNEDNKVKFLQEVAAMGQFNHPHVVRLFGVVTIGKPVSDSHTCRGLAFHHFLGCDVTLHHIVSFIVLAIETHRSQLITFW